MVEMLGGRKVPSGYYVLVKLASQLSSLYSTDIREALVGVGLVVKNERSGIATLDKGICCNSCLCASVCEVNARFTFAYSEFPASDFRSHAFLPQFPLFLIRIILPQSVLFRASHHVSIAVI